MATSLKKEHQNSRLLLVFALPQEAGKSFEGYPKIFTGIGKINAALGLTRQLEQLRVAQRLPQRILNLGTCGSAHFSRGAVVEIERFQQGDMDLTGAGFLLGETPFDPFGSTLHTESFLTNQPRATCVTSDRLRKDLVDKDSKLVVDMEAYALKKVALTYKLPFACIKMVSDSGGPQAFEEFKAQLRLVPQKLLEVVQPVL